MGASTLATLLIKLGFVLDSSAAGAAKAQIQGIGAAGQQAGAQVNNALNAVDAKMRATANTAGFLKTTLATALGFAGSSLLVGAFQFAENAMIGFNARLEQARIGFTTMLGSGGAADMFIQKMKDFANVTPFEFAGLQEAVQRMLAVGFASDTVLETLRDIGDAVAALGGNTEMLNRVVYVMSQIKTAGRLVGQDMMQLTSSGIPAWQMLADAMGKSVAQVRDLVTKGLVPADEAIDIITKGMREKFGGMMAAQARTFQGAMSTIKDSALSAIAGAVKPAFDVLAAGMVGLADFLTNGGGSMIAPLLFAIGAVLVGVVIPAILSTVGTLLAAKVALLEISTPILPLIAVLTMLGIAFQNNFLGIRDIVEDNLKPLMFIVAAIAALFVGKWAMSLLAAADAMAINAIGAISLAAAEMALAGATTFAEISMATIAVTAAVALAPFVILAAALIGLAAAFQWAKGKADEANAALTSQVGEIVKRGDLDELKHAREVIESEIKKIQAVRKASPLGFAELFGLDGLDELQGQLAKLDAGIKTAEELASHSKVTVGGIKVDMNEDLLKQLGTSMKDVVEAASVAGSDAMMAMAEGIAAFSHAPEEAFKKAMQITKDALPIAAQIARDVGILMSPEYAAGIKSGIPEVAAAWAAVGKAAQENLDRNTDKAFTAGMNAGKGYAKAWAEEQAKAGASPVAIRQELRTWDPSDMAAKVAAYKALGEVWKNQYAPSADAARAALAMLHQEESVTPQVAASGLLQQFQGDADAIREMGSELEKDWNGYGGDIMKAFASGVKSNSELPLNAMKDLLDKQRDVMSPGKQELTLVGLLASKELASGLADGRPEVVAQAIITKNELITELNNVSKGAYAAGADAIMALAAGMVSPAAFKAINTAAAQVRFVTAVAADPKNYTAALAELRAATSLVIPNFAAAGAAARDWGDSLNGAGSAASDLSSEIKTRLGNAFDEISYRAHKFFDKLHDDNRKAIEDTRDLHNEQLQGPLDAAQGALDAKRAAEQLFQLQKAVATARDPEARADAMIRLADYQAQMQIDAQQRVVDAQKKINDDLADQQLAAEDERNTESVRNFDKSLDKLRDYLERHPKEWRKAQKEIIDLLGKYGVDYEGAGVKLGKAFVKGINDQAGLAQQAFRDLAKLGSGGTAATPGYVVTPGGGGGTGGGGTPKPSPQPYVVQHAPGTGPLQYDTGAWKLLTDQLAYLHAGEMVVPRTIAESLRAALAARGSGMNGLEGLFSGQSGKEWQTLGGGGSAKGELGGRMGQRTDEAHRTIIIQVGSEKLAEVNDRGLHNQGTVYAKPVVHNGSTR